MDVENPSVEKLWREANELAGYFLQRQIDNAYSVAVICLMLSETCKGKSAEDRLRIERMVHDALFPPNEVN